jgi:putative ABC transport system permease protein
MRKLKYIFKNSLIAIRYYKLRTFFSILGVALGIASLSIIIAAVEGAYKKAYEVVESFGPDSILIFGGRQEKKGIRNRDKTLTIKDIEELKRTFPFIKLIMPIVIYKGKVHRGGEVLNTTIYGVDNNYEEAWSWYLSEGRFFTEEEIKQKKYVCILGVYVRNQLFKPEEDPLGKTIFINKIPCKIIGVLEPRGTTLTGRNLDNRILMPYTSVMYKILHDPKYITAIRIRFYKGVDIAEAVEEIKAFLVFSKKAKSEDFFILTPNEILRFLFALTGSLVLFLGLSSMISLTIGGFVLSNLILLSVNERRVEIGIRRALGAKRKDIIFHFLIEITILVSIGAVIGFLFGMIGAKLLKNIADFPTSFSFIGFIISLIVSIIVGLISAISPSLKASKLEPAKAIKR